MDVFIVETDASRKKVAGTLKQMQTNSDNTRSEHLIAYFSKDLSKVATQTYSVLEIEMLVLYSSLVAFQVFLLGSHFLVRTDHKVLEHLMTDNKEPPTPRVKKLLWKLASFQFGFDIRYVKPQKVALSDFLFRHLTPVIEDDNTIIPIGITDKQLRETATGMDHLLAVTRAQGNALKTNKNPTSNTKAKHAESPTVKTSSAPHQSSTLDPTVIHEPNKTNTRTEPTQKPQPLPVTKTIRDFPFHSGADSQPTTTYEYIAPPSSPELLNDHTLWSNEYPEPQLLRKIPRQHELDETLTKHIFSKYKSVHLPYTREQIAKAQQSDPHFGQISKFLKYTNVPGNAAKAKSIAALAESFVLLDDVLFYLKPSNKKQHENSMPDAVLAVPKEYIFVILH